MKYFKGLKRVKKSTKIGLATSAVYAASAFALPAFANTVEQPVFQPVDVTTITTSEQAKTLYNQKLAEYCADKKINPQEIEELYLMATKGLSLDNASVSRAEREFEEGYQGIYREVHEQIGFLSSEKEKLCSPVKKLEERIKLENEKLSQIDKQAKTQLLFSDYKKQLKGIQEEVNNILVAYYPGLLKGTSTDYNNLHYFVEDKLVKEAEERLRPLMEEADKIFMEAYQKEGIQSLLRRELTLHDLIVFRHTLKSVQNIKPSQKDYDKLKREKLALVQQLEQEKALIAEKIRPELEVLKSKVGTLEQKLKELYQKEREERSKIRKRDSSFDVAHLFKIYLNRHDDIKDFTKNYTDLSKYFSLSFWHLETGYLYDGKKDKTTPAYSAIRERLGDGKELISRLEDYFTASGYDVKITDKLPNPGIPKWPLWTIPMVIAAPFLRNLFTVGYVSSGKATKKDYQNSAGLAFAESALFWILIDAVHPLMLPIRMVGVPVVWHGILRLTGGDKAIFDYAKK